MSAPATAERLLQILNQGVEHATALLSALRDEHDALQQRSASAIEAALEQKTQRLAVFEKQEVERRALLKALHVTDSRQAVDDFIAVQPAHASTLRQRWNQLLKLADECRNQNQLNGALVETQRRHVQRALDILSGTPESATYGPSGSTDRRSGSHTLAKA